MEKDLEERIRGPISFNNMMTKIEIAQEKHLKKTKKIKIGIKGKKPILSAVWMDKKGQILIKTRRIKNRAWRYARQKKAPGREIQILKRKYELQQRVTSLYLGKRKGEWENRKILEARGNSKILWNFTRDIAGKTKGKEVETYIYTENGEKKNSK